MYWTYKNHPAVLGYTWNDDEAIISSSSGNSICIPFFDSNGDCQSVEFKWSGSPYSINAWTNTTGSWANTLVTSKSYNIKFDCDIDSNDKLHIAYVDYDSGRYTWTNFRQHYKQIYYSTNSTGSWVETLVVDVTTPVNDYVYCPTVFVDSSQNVHMTYNQVTSGAAYARLMYTMFNGSTWSTPEVVIAQVYQSGNADDIIHGIIKNNMASDGTTVMIVGKSSDNTKFNCFRRSGGSWSKFRVWDNGVPSNVGIITTGAGAYEMYGYQLIDGDYRLFKAAYSGSSWSDISYITDVGEDYRMSGPQYTHPVRIDPNGRRYIATDFPIGCYWSDDASTWSFINIQTEQPSTYNGTFHDDINVFGDSSSELFAITYEWESDDYFVHFWSFNTTE